MLDQQNGRPLPFRYQKGDGAENEIRFSNDHYIGPLYGARNGRESPRHRERNRHAA